MGFGQEQEFYLVHHQVWDTDIRPGHTCGLVLELDIDRGSELGIDQERKFDPVLV